MVVILIFAIIVLLAVAVVSIISKYFKLSVYMKGLFFFGILVSMIFILFFLSSVSTYFSFDLVHGGDKLYSRSITKSESIKRGVYLRDLKLDPSPFHLNDTMSIKIKEAWIEKDWTQGYWFWTTQQGVNGEYNITIIIDEVKGNWIIKRGITQEYLHYDSIESELTGTIRGLPKSDTIRYYVLKENKMDFSESDIIGEIKFALEKK